MSDDAKYRFSYRLFLRTDKKGGGAMQLTTKLSEGEPVTLKQAEDSLKNAVERIIDNFRIQDETK